MILDTHTHAIYTLLARDGAQGIAAIARQTGLHRPTIYATLAAMEHTKIVTKTQHGARTQYMLREEGDIRAFVDARKADLSREADDLLAMVSANMQSRKLSNKDDIIALYDELVTSLTPQDSYYSFTTSTYSATRIAEYFPKHFREVREKKNLWSYVLSLAPINKKIGVRFSLEIKQINIPGIEENCLWLIFGDTYAFIDMDTESGYAITHPRIAQFQKQIFLALYNATPSRSE